jgi:hypothetical protein
MDNSFLYPPQQPTEPDKDATTILIEILASVSRIEGMLKTKTSASEPQLAVGGMQIFDELDIPPMPQEF